MITSYNQFIGQKINEEKDIWGNEGGSIFSSLKNLFGKLMQNINDDLKKPVDDLTNKLNKTKDTKQIKNIINNYLKVHNTALTSDLKKVKTPVELKKLIKDNLTAIYASIIAQIKSLGEDKFSFSEIFADSPESMKKLFDKNEKNFQKNLDSFVNNLIADQAAQFGYDKKELFDKLSAVKESVIIDKLFEQDEPTEDEQAEQIAQAQGKESPEPKGDFNKLRDAIKKWFDFAIYKKVQDELKKEKEDKKGEGNLLDKIKNIQSTKNIDSVNKMVDAITKLDKEQLIKVRDLLGLDKDSAPL